jgi:hypothetical protein
MMSKLSKTQVYAIYWLNSQNKDIGFIAKDLKITNKQIINILSRKTDDTTNNDRETVVDSINAKNLMITHTSGQKVNTVAIMTKDASSLGDKIQTKDSATNNRNDNAIFRPKKSK